MRKYSIDVIIPSIRISTTFLEKLSQIDVPQRVELQFYIIIDNPKIKLPDLESFSDLDIQIIKNKTNLGAGQARNVGLEHAQGDFILFLDDDITPKRDLIQKFIEALDKEESDNFIGFAGVTYFPSPVNSFTKGLVYSDILTFFPIAKWMDTLYWGVTANLLLRRKYIDGIRFQPIFPKAGGGEDIDFCLNLVEQTGKKIKSVPAASVEHPWWKEGKRSYARFFRWAYGDSQLPKIHPQHSYRNFPNLIETSFIAVVVAIFSTIFNYNPWLFLMLVFGLLGDIFIESLRIKQNHHVWNIKIAFEATLIRLANDLGRFIGILQRFNILRICERFDYFCDGKHINNERKYAFTKFVLYCLIAVILLILPIF